MPPAKRKTPAGAADGSPATPPPPPKKVVRASGVAAVAGAANAAPSASPKRLLPQHLRPASAYRAPYNAAASAAPSRAPRGVSAPPRPPPPYGYRPLPPPPAQRGGRGGGGGATVISDSSTSSRSPLPPFRRPGRPAPAAAAAARKKAASNASVGAGRGRGGKRPSAPPFPPPSSAARLPPAPPPSASAGAPLPNGGGLVGHPDEDTMHSHASSAASCESLPRAANAVDEAIDEANALLRAAAEAQALGRLRTSYSCLLLAHSRLVGLGRRVDRSYCEAEEDSPSATAGAGAGGEASNQASNLSHSRSTPAFHPPLVAQPPLPPALVHGYSDVAYVEHLARSAMELHHRRTGRGMQHDLQAEKMAHVAAVKKREKDELQEASRGLYVLSRGGQGDDDDVTPTKRKGGRGKKPPTLVMHTVAGRNLDMRDLMRGVL
ncbi:hypothetical protein ACHAWF_007637 [Thalassiosira exigua]